MNAVIMAQGKQERLRSLGGSPKQLLPVSGEETIFGRTARLLKERGVSEIVVVAHQLPAWQEAAKKAGVLYTTNADPGPLLQGLAASRLFWKEETLILLGDVVFSKAMMNEVVLSRQEPIFFGRFGANVHTGKWYGELFGLRLSKENRGGVDVVLDDESVRTNPLSNLWMLREKTGIRVQMLVGDWTDDIDNDQDKNRVLPILQGLAGAGK